MLQAQIYLFLHKFINLKLAIAYTNTKYIQ